MPVQIFVSHTKFDTDFLNQFDIAEARLGKVHLYRSEYEKIDTPFWATIQSEINKSRAVFLLIGKELVKLQAIANTSPEAMTDWKHTQNWISHEIGLASQRLMDVWVLCDDVEINFPVPYFNNYVLRRDFNFYKKILKDYSDGKKYRTFRGLIPFTLLGLSTWKKTAISCPNKRCRVTFNLHSSLHEGESYTCPACLEKITMNADWTPYPELKEKI
jgi:hypothetical protein